MEAVFTCRPAQCRTGAAGHEGEGSWGRWLLEQNATVMQHEQAAVEQLADLDAGTVEGTLMRSGRKLQGVSGDRDYVVAPDHAPVAAGQVARGRSPSRDAVARLT